MKKGAGTYRTVIESVKNGAVTDRDEVFHEGECRIETDGEGHIIRAEFDEERGAATSLLIRGDNRVDLSRKGEMTSEFRFDPDNMTKAKVDTPYGSMELDLVTHTAEVISGPSGADIRIGYGFPEAPAQRHMISMSIRFS